MTTTAPAPPAVQPSTELNLTLTLEEKRPLSEGVVELVLKARSTLPPWGPGAHVDLLLGPDLARQYSLCGDPADRRYLRVAVLRETDGRGGSAYVHDELAVGTTLQVRGPRNHFPLVEAPRYQFIAGGIGITPILAMVRAAEAAGADWHLLYGGRSRASMAYLAELASYGDRVRVQPADTDGLLDLASVLGTPREDTAVYCCGPEVLLDAVEQHCASWPAGSLHLERFAPRAVDPDTVDTEFEVEFARSGVTATVPAGVSILDVATAEGVFVVRSCSEGVCGTCETVVLDGEPDHRDSVLGDDDRAEGCFMPCVSRACSDRLVLDL
ncbi:ferredoxin-NADP reductase [Nocardioides aromaticivorans]|uniref:Ferredoxin-NADP reductase n=1 Tax=Nocardioides aromaticivorans TaxID=200618 RepID=A0A7Y9ZJP3_9ACTN|nr:PDR/VanB family oxidoreductase [Nocardioides aromaticivorans]NYI45190.1 ferredoxin-NADP reductase [Nocardioides aromaticivorans]